MSNRPTPDRLRLILQALAKLHTELLQQETLKTQEPQSLQNVKQMLKQTGAFLLNCLRTNSFRTSEEYSEAIQKCLETLRENSTPWDADVSTLTPYWIDRMFFKAPFAISPDHIETLFRNSQVQQENDGDA